MDEVLQMVFSAQTIFVCLSVYVVTFVIRRVAETVWPDVKFNRYWREIFVPVGPIMIGAGLGLFMKTWLFPDIIGDSLSVRAFYGAICGLFSAFMYNRVRSWLKSKTGGDPSSEDAASLPLLDSLPPMGEKPKDKG